MNDEARPLEAEAATAVIDAPRADEPRPDAPPPAPPPPAPGQGRLAAIVLVVVCWTYAYNVLIKGHGPLVAFFKIVDTISDDFVIGSLLTIAVGAVVLALFSVTKLYSQIMANAQSFRILETMLIEDLARWRLREFAVKLLNFREQPQPDGCCPSRVWGVLAGLALLYFVSWIYVVLFSEALFFASWSAGVNLDITERNVVLMPMLALSIPFSARVMAYLRYPYAQDYADFMPGAVFVLLVVGSLGFLFESNDQQFYLVRVFSDPTFVSGFLRNGLFLAFIPVFFESACWIVELSRHPAAGGSGGAES